MRSLILAALFGSAVLTSAVADELSSEIHTDLLQSSEAAEIRKQAYYEILGINPVVNLISPQSPLLDNVTDAQIVFRPTNQSLQDPGSLSVYAGKKLSIKRMITLVSESIGYEVNFSKVSEKTLETKILLPSSAISVVDLLHEIEDQTSIDVVLYPKNAGQYILMIE